MIDLAHKENSPVLRIRRYNPPMYNAAPTQIAGNGNRLNTVTNSYGKTLTLSYDVGGTAGRINSVTDGTWAFGVVRL